jgi:hypothetical protein
VLLLYGEVPVVKERVGKSVLMLEGEGSHLWLACGLLQLTLSEWGSTDLATLSFYSFGHLEDGFSREGWLAPHPMAAIDYESVSCDEGARFRAKEHGREGYVALRPHSTDWNGQLDEVSDVIGS